MILEKAYVVPMYAQIGVIPVRSYVKGVPVPATVPWNYSNRATIWLDK